MKKQKDTYSYRGWLNSDIFLKRAFAIAGYSMIPMLIIYGIILVIVLILFLFFGLVSVVSGTPY